MDIPLALLFTLMIQCTVGSAPVVSTGTSKEVALVEKGVFSASGKSLEPCLAIGECGIVNLFVCSCVLIFNARLLFMKTLMVIVYEMFNFLYAIIRIVKCYI